MFLWITNNTVVLKIFFQDLGLIEMLYVSEWPSMKPAHWKWSKNLALSARLGRGKTGFFLRYKSSNELALKILIGTASM